MSDVLTQICNKKKEWVESSKNKFSENELMTENLAKIYFNQKKYIKAIEAYKIAEEQNTWIASVGCFADWYYPDFIDKIYALYPGLIPKKNTNKPEEILFDTNCMLGLLYLRLLDVSQN